MRDNAAIPVNNKRMTPVFRVGELLNKSLNILQADIGTENTYHFIAVIHRYEQSSTRHACCG
jgi:hypothetical protein